MRFNPLAPLTIFSLLIQISAICAAEGRVICGVNSFRQPLDVNSDLEAQLKHIELEIKKLNLKRDEIKAAIDAERTPYIYDVTELTPSNNNINVILNPLIEITLKGDEISLPNEIYKFAQLRDVYSGTIIDFDVESVVHRKNEDGSVTYWGRPKDFLRPHTEYVVLTKKDSRGRGMTATRFTTGDNFDAAALEAKLKKVQDVAKTLGPLNIIEIKTPSEFIVKSFDASPNLEHALVLEFNRETTADYLTKHIEITATDDDGNYLEAGGILVEKISPTQFRIRPLNLRTQKDEGWRRNSFYHVNILLPEGRSFKFSFFTDDGR